MVASWSVDALGADERRVAVSGQFDVSTEEAFVRDVGELLEPADVAAVQLDFSAVDFIDSSGVRAVLRLHQRRPGAVTITAASPPVLRVFQIAGVADLLFRGAGASP